MKRPQTPQFERQPAQYVSITLPRPLSANDLWKPHPGGGIMLTPEYKAWIKECGWEIVRQRPGRMEGRYSLKITIEDGLKLDTDNVPKACGDLLQAHGVVSNDRLCRRLEVEWSPRVAGVCLLLIAMKGV